MSFRALITCLTLTIGSGCASTVPPEPPLCLPERPVLLEVSTDEQLQVPTNTLRKFAFNDLSLKLYARELESRINIHDEPLDSC